MSLQNGVKRIACLIVVIAAAGCASVPLDHPKTDSFAMTDTDVTSLGRASNDWRSNNPDRGGFYPLTKGLDAFGARLVLMDSAERSIDAQYFLMKPDDAGLVFGAKLIAAADRGVRVRFLLDDVFTTVDDSALISVNEHPNIEVRIFNPISRKGVFALNYVGNFRLANRRMHNKSFTVDNQVSIVGGRNIAEEYFQLDTTGEFIDFDMLSVGPIVKDISASFDTYWNHELAIPMDALYENYDAEDLPAIRARIDAQMKASGETVYGAAVNTELMNQLISGAVDPFVADARMIVDDPRKLQEKVSQEHKIVATEIVEALQNARDEILIYTPYFIPGKKALKLSGRSRAGAFASYS
jgi:putative cardiolipin synthase